MPNPKEALKFDAGNTYMAYNSLARFSVPVFVMISGALMLDKQYSLHELYKNKILRIIIAYFFWSFVYSFLSHYKEMDLKGMVIDTLAGHYHLWFLPMIACMYAIIPIINLIISKKKNMQYFLILAFIFSFCLPQLYTLLCNFGNPQIVVFTEALKSFTDNMNFKIGLGFSSYFVLGYYLKNNDFTNKCRYFLYSLTFFSIICELFFSYYTGIVLKESVQYMSYFSISVLLLSISLYLVFKYKLNKKGFSFLMQISKCTFGIYLIHDKIREKIIYGFNLAPTFINPIIAIPLIALGVFLISMAISYILNKIPIVNKYLV